MTNLNQLLHNGSDWIIETASNINDAGQIVGTGEAPNGERHGYLLIPAVGGAPPAAVFVGTPLSGCAQLGVSFTDLSSGDMTGWSWDFGDGGTSTLQNPAYTYQNVGIYTVSLTVNAPSGSDISTRVDYIVVDPPCGDADGNGGVDIDDVVHLINYIFSGGSAPNPTEAGDADCSGGVDIDDVVYLINYIFSGGNAPCDADGDEVPDC
jgi:hypothetical protein